MVGFGETYFAAFALLLGASPFQVGFIATFPILVGAAFQMLAPAGARWAGDKPWVVASAVLQGATFLPILVLGRSEGGDGFSRLLPWICVYWVLALVINPAWNAWVGRMIPSRIRSRYFARRNVAIQSALFLSVLAAGFLIEAATRTSWGAASGFMAVFTVAAASRLGSAYFLGRQHDPGSRARDELVPLREVLAGFPREPYGRLILLAVFMNASVMVSAAYFTPFLLKGLALSYAGYTILTGAGVVSRVMASPYWGEIARGYGSRRALQVAAALLVPLPALWVVSENYAYLIGLQLVAGFAWSAYELTTFLNFFDCTTERNRARVLSIYNLLNGFAMVGGSLLGGIILRRVGEGGYAHIFVLSSLLRATALFFLGRGVGRRLRAVEQPFQEVFLRVLTLRGPEDRPAILPPTPPEEPEPPSGDRLDPG